MAKIHVAKIGIFTVDASGNRLDKSRGNHSIAEMTNTSNAVLLLPDASIPNTLGYPNISTYLANEHSEGYEFKHMDQTFVITYKP